MKDNKLNVLILIAKYGLGHYMVAKAVKQEIEKESNIEIVDFFELAFPKTQKLIYGVFEFLVKNCSSIYNILYKISSNTNNAQFSSIMKNRIQELIERKNPDIVISTFPVCTRYISKYMKKDGLPIGHSTLAILTEFSSFQLVTILMAVIGFVTKYKFIEESVGNIKYLLMIGVFINTFILIMIILSIFSKKIIINLVNILYKILTKLKIKKANKFKEKCIEQINEYKKGAKLLINNPNVLLKIILTTVIQITLFHSIPFFIYLSLGLDSANFFLFLSLQSVLYISVSSLPFPGAIGVSEGGFMAIYNLLFPVQVLESAMLLSRGISFYLFVVLSGGCLMVIKIYSLKKSKFKIKN